MNIAVVTDTRQCFEAAWCTYLTGKNDNFQSHVYDLAVSQRGFLKAASPETGMPFKEKMAGLAERCYMLTKPMLESLTDSFQFNDLLVLVN